MKTSADRFLVLSSAIALLLASPAAAQDKVELYDYVIKEGDTCVGIAIRELGDRRAYRTIHKHNPMGPTPHKLVPGEVLRLPRTKRRADGRLGSKRGEVRYRSPDVAWSSATRGMDLFRNWRVNTQERASAGIDFRDDSRLELREETTVILYGPSRTKARRITKSAYLETGALRAALGRKRKRPLVIASAAALAEIGRGTALMVVEEAKKLSTVANHGGSPVTVKSPKVKGASVRVPVGFGTKVEEGKAPQPPRPLPPAPEWRFRARFFPALSGSGQIVAKWVKGANVERYRVQVSTDAAGADVVASREFGASTTRVVVSGIPAGDYFLRVSSIDGESFEGPPSLPFRARVYPLDGVANGLAPGSRVGIGSEIQKQVAVVPKGTVLRPPPHLPCVLAGANGTTANLVVPAAGKVELRCLDGMGQPLQPVFITVR